VDENVVHGQMLCACQSGCDRDATIEMTSSRVASLTRSHLGNPTRIALYRFHSSIFIEHMLIK
jgi:hypothetical protein